MKTALCSALIHLFAAISLPHASLAACPLPVDSGKGTFELQPSAPRPSGPFKPSKPWSDPLPEPSDVLPPVGKP